MICDVTEEAASQTAALARPGPRGGLRRRRRGEERRCLDRAPPPPMASNKGGTAASKNSPTVKATLSYIVITLITVSGRDVINSFSFQLSTWGPRNYLFTPVIWLMCVISADTSTRTENCLMTSDNVSDTGVNCASPRPSPPSFPASRRKTRPRLDWGK